MDSGFENGMFDHFNSTINISNMIDKEGALEFYGPKTIRFFITEEKECKTNENMYKSDENFLKITNLKCYYQDYNNDKHKNKKDWLGIKYSDDTDIKHIVNSFNGKFDKTGHMIRFTNFTDIMNLKSNNNFKEDLNYNRGIIGYEYLFTLYDLNSDVFIANVIFVLRSNINYALPFKIAIALLASINAILPRGLAPITTKSASFLSIYLLGYLVASIIDAIYFFTESSIYIFLVIF